MSRPVDEVSVCFVCLGNICRSPTAEGVFRALVDAEGMTDAIHIDSAGTGAWHAGEPADARARASLVADELRKQAVAGGGVELLVLVAHADFIGLLSRALLRMSAAPSPNEVAQSNEAS